MTARSTATAMGSDTEVAALRARVERLARVGEK